MKRPMQKKVRRNVVSRLSCLASDPDGGVPSSSYLGRSAIARPKSAVKTMASFCCGHVFGKTMSALETIEARKWSPGSWRGLESLQMAEYEDKALEASVLAKLSKLPPLVQPAECDQLKAMLAQAAEGKAFIVQGGDCAERFMDCEAERLEAQLKVLVQMGAIVGEATGVPPVVIARIAGQYGKPRSKPTETVEGYGEIMSFKGDNINGYEPSERKWDPKRLLDGYFHSAATLNYLRSLRMSADLSSFREVDAAFTQALPNGPQHAAVAAGVKKHGKGAEAALFFTAHEAMQLNLEEALTRPVGGAHYNLSAHLVWIGDRTRQLLGGHVEYFRGLANPLGVKVGPSMKDDELAELVAVLNPRKEAGKLLLITRYGKGKVEQFLPGHIKAVKVRNARARDAPLAARPSSARPLTATCCPAPRLCAPLSASGERRAGGLAVRRRARQHRLGQGRAQDAPLRRRDGRGRQGARDPPRGGQRAGGRAPRADGPGERHRVHGRLHACDRGRPRQELRDLVRPAPQRQAGDRGRLHDRARARPAGCPK